MSFEREARAFLWRKDRERRHATAMAALFLSIGVDLAQAEAATESERARLRLRLLRLIERERQRGLRRHWSYDLNRHIALKQALDSLASPAPSAKRRAAAP